MDRAKLQADWAKQRKQFDDFVRQVETAGDTVALTRAYSPVPWALYTQLLRTAEDLENMVAVLSDTLQSASAGEIDKAMRAIQDKHREAQRFKEALEREMKALKA